MDNVFASPCDNVGQAQYCCHTALSSAVAASCYNCNKIRNIPTSRLLGSGSYGSVYLGQIGTRVVAVKRLHSTTKSFADSKEKIAAEQRLLLLSHPNIVRMLATTTDTRPNDAVLVMEFVGEFSLQQIINKADVPIDICTRIRYGLDIANGLNYIHNKGIVHLDLKPANIILSPGNVCKIVDFGCSQETDRNGSAVTSGKGHSLIGTFAYSAPELFRNRPLSTKADIYSFGVTLWQMLSLEQPYCGMQQDRVIFAVVSTHLRPQLPDNIRLDRKLHSPVEDYYQELFRQCWDADAEIRPQAADIVDVLSTWNEDLTSWNDELSQLDNSHVRKDSGYEDDHHSRYELDSVTHDTTLELTN